MGQYYMPTLISEDGTVRTLYSHAYDNGLKLMEHSYIGNNFVNAVLTLLWESPCRLAWIGDYSDEQYGDPYEAKLPHEDFMQYYEAAWGDKRKEVQIKPEPRNILTMESTDTYLVNHTRRCYIHIGEYIAANQWTKSGEWINGRYDPHAASKWCINPLPLLTACGNNRGGGDYYNGHPCFDDVGTWAFDLIEVTDKCPEGYENVSCISAECGLPAAVQNKYGEGHGAPKECGKHKPVKVRRRCHEKKKDRSHGHSA